MRLEENTQTMLARIYSLTLITAILACPMACGIAPCCAENEFDSDRSQSQDSTCDCHCASAKGSPNEDEPLRPSSQDDLPFDAPCEHETPCQGVCGGAVLEKPFVPSFDLAFTAVVVLEQPDFQFVFRCSHPLSEADDHSGRELRTLHMSFLC